MNAKMPVIYRQFMDIYNLLEFSLHLDLCNMYYLFLRIKLEVITIRKINY